MGVNNRHGTDKRIIGIAGIHWSISLPESQSINLDLPKGC